MPLVDEDFNQIDREILQFKKVLLIMNNLDKNKLTTLSRF